MSGIEINSMRKKLLREVVNAKVRFIAITAVVVIGVMIFIASSMSYRNLKTSYEYTYKKLRFADFRIKADRIPKYLIEKAEKINGIEMVTPRVRKDISISLENGKRLMGRVTGLPYSRPIVDDLLIKDGRYFKKGDRMVCIAESHFAEFYGLKPGEHINYIREGSSIPIKIIGVAGSPEYIILAGEKGDYSPMLSASTMGIFWMPIQDVQAIAGLSGYYNQALFKVHNPSNMEPQIRAVEDLFKDTGISELLTQDEHMGNKMLQEELKGFKNFALFFPILFLGIACFSIYILLSRLVHTQRPFIGVMRAIGYSRKQILYHYLSFAMLIGILGAVIGAFSGYGLSYFITSVYASTIGIPLVKIRMEWITIFQGMSLSVLFCSFAGLVPAIRSIKIDPARAMRGELQERAFRMPILERVAPVFSRVPLFLKIPFRNMFRNRRRTLFTVIGLVFSVMIVLVFLASLNTASDALDRGFRLNNRFDMVAIFLGARDEATIGKIRKILGVEAVEPTVGASCKVSWDSESTETVMMGIPSDTNMKSFYTPDRIHVDLQKRYVLLNQWFHIKKRLKEGDVVTVATSYRKQNFFVGPFVEEPMGNIVYIDRDDARKLLAYGTTSRGGFYIKVLPGYRDSVRKALEKLPGLATVLDLEDVKREVDRYMKLMYIIIYVMLVFALIMAFTLTFNTITINILEREREIATMRTLGTESWKIGTMTTLENLLYGLFSIVPGSILGVLVGRYAMSLQQTEYFTLKLVVYGSSYLMVAAGIIVILVLCQFPSLTYVRKVDLARATKERGG